MELNKLQEDMHKWRRHTIDFETTPLTQAAHTSVESSEVLDLLVKANTYTDRRADDEELKRELGDVIIAHLGTMTLLGFDADECIEAALEKNNQRNWTDWQNHE